MLKSGNFKYGSIFLAWTGYDIMIYSTRLGLSCEQPPQGNPSHMWIVMPLMLGNYCPSHAIWVVKTITQKEMDELTYVNLEDSNLRSTRWHLPKLHPLPVVKVLLCDFMSLLAPARGLCFLDARSQEHSGNSTPTGGALHLQVPVGRKKWPIPLIFNIPPETIVDVGGFMYGTIKIGCFYDSGIIGEVPSTYQLKHGTRASIPVVTPNTPSKWITSNG